MHYCPKALETNVIYNSDLALNNLQMLICYKTQPTKTPSNRNTKTSVKILFEMSGVTLAILKKDPTLASINDICYICELWTV